MPAFVETFVVSHCLVINLALVFLKHVVGCDRLCVALANKVHCTSYVSVCDFYATHCTFTMHACAFGVDVDNSPLTCDSKPHLRYYTKNANLLLWTNHQNGRSVAAITGSWTFYVTMKRTFLFFTLKMSFGKRLDTVQTLKHTESVLFLSNYFQLHGRSIILEQINFGELYIWFRS